MKSHYCFKIHQKKHCDLEYLNSHFPNEECVPTVLTTKGGIRRKHHHPSTLHDMMKLVEYVSRCGVGKWPYIKKVIFSSSAYLTFTDLKVANDIFLMVGDVNSGG